MKIKMISVGLIVVTALTISACAAGKSEPEANMEEEVHSSQPIFQERALSVDAKTESEESTGSQDGTLQEMPASEGTIETEEPGSEKIAGPVMDEEASHDAGMGQEPSSPESMIVQEMMSGEAWYGVDLVDVVSGATFKVSDFHGKVVLVETLAVWCSTCLRQQNQVRALHDAVGHRDDLISIGLDIDPNETPDILKMHAREHGFDWLYAVAPVEVAREIGQLYGTQFLNPPSAPMLIIDRQGRAHPLPFGVKSAQALQEALTPFLN